MAVSTDVNDPSFGLETDQSSPNFGLAPEQAAQESTGLAKNLGTAQKAMGFAQDAYIYGVGGAIHNAMFPEEAKIVKTPLVSAEIVQPIRKALQYPLQTLNQIVTGEEFKEPLPQLGEFASENIAGQTSLEALGLLTAGGIVGKMPKIREIAFGKPPEVAPEVMPAGTPATFAPAEEPYNHETGLQVMPETRFQMVDEPTPEIAPARNIMESARYSQTSRPGQETPLASDAFPSISRSAEESRRAARTVETGIQSETARVGGEPEPLVIPEVNTPESLATEARAATGDTEVPNFNPHGTEPGQEVTAVQESQPLTTAEPLPKTETPPTEAVVSTPESAAKAEPVGIAERYREDELGSGSVIPGVGKTPAEARDWGHDFINKGGNPYDLVNKKGPKKELWQEVGGVRAEYERLGIEKRKAEAALEANPDDPLVQMAFDNADEAQRKWSKDMQPVLTRAGDALRAASRAYPREINSFSDFTDILHDHYGGEVELTPVKRAEIQKLVKATKQVNGEANGAREAVTNEVVKRAGGKVLPFEELKADLRGAMEELLKDCPV